MRLAYVITNQRTSSSERMSNVEFMIIEKPYKGMSIVASSPGERVAGSAMVAFEELGT